MKLCIFIYGLVSAGWVLITKVKNCQVIRNGLTVLFNYSSDRRQKFPEEHRPSSPHDGRPPRGGSGC